MTTVAEFLDRIEAAIRGSSDYPARVQAWAVLAAIVRPARQAPEGCDGIFWLDAAPGDAGWYRLRNAKSLVGWHAAPLWADLPDIPDQWLEAIGDPPDQWMGVLGDPESTEGQP